jgi:hypothetical protein
VKDSQRYFRLTAEDARKLSESLSPEQIGNMIVALAELAESKSAQASIPSDGPGVVFGMTPKEAGRALREFQKVGWCIVRELPGETFVTSRHFSGPRSGPGG